MRCTQCGVEFTSKRATAKYCSNKCKLACHRENLSVSNLSVSEDKSLSGTNELLPKYFCKCCKKDLEKDKRSGENVHLICICWDCVQAGKKHNDYCDCGGET